MSLTVSMPPGTVPWLGLANCDLPQSSARLSSSQETSIAGFQETSKLRRRAAHVFKATRPEYERSFGVQLRSLQGRCRWDIVDKVASIWSELQHTLQEALRRPDQNIFKGCSIRQPAVLHCYMIGYDQKCAHPTIAICHPIAKVLMRSVKLISGMVKSVRHECLG